jgi:S-phase kinase-associated protein 1
MKVDDDTIRDIILAANYLDISRLLTLGCKSVANIVKHKSVEEIREYFGLPKEGETETQ